MRDPTLNRRHFELIAGIINSLDLAKMGAATSAPTDELRLHIAQEFSRALENSNQQFNRTMFMNACTESDRKRKVKLTKRNAAEGDEVSRPRSSGEPAFYND